jgi:hypothetical protein
MLLQLRYNWSSEISDPGWHTSDRINILSGVSTIPKMLSLAIEFEYEYEGWAIKLALALRPSMVYCAYP